MYYPENSGKNFILNFSYGKFLDRSISNLTLFVRNRNDIHTVLEEFKSAFLRICSNLYLEYPEYTFIKLFSSNNTDCNQKLLDKLYDIGYSLVLPSSFAENNFDIVYISNMDKYIANQDSYVINDEMRIRV